MNRTATNPHDAVMLALLTGELMLSYGGETYRVEDTMKRILESCDFIMSESFVTTTGIFASCEDKDAGVITALKRVKVRSYEFEKIIEVNKISRMFTSKEISCAEATARLEKVKLLPSFPIWLVILAIGVASSCFAYLLGGSIADSLNAMFTGFILQCCLTPLKKTRLPSFLLSIFSGGVIALVSLVILTLGLGDNIDRVIIGALMPMLPGLALTNAIRDIVEGDFLSGTTRMTDAVLSAIAIAAGVGSMLGLWNNLSGGRFFG